MKLKYNKQYDVWQDQNDSGIVFCDCILSQFGLQQQNKYTLEISKIPKRGFRQVNLTKIISYWTSDWTWDIKNITMPYKWFMGHTIDSIIDSLFPGKLAGRLYFKFRLTIPKKQPYYSL